MSWRSLGSSKEFRLEQDFFFNLFKEDLPRSAGRPSVVKPLPLKREVTLPWLDRSGKMEEIEPTETVTQLF